MRIQTLDDDPYELGNLSRDQLVEDWRSLLGCDPPKGLSARIIMFAVAYELQARAHGNLSLPLKQKLRNIATVSSGVQDKVGCALTPGTRLVREWQGTVYVVDVTDEGFRWQGKVWKSLSVIARRITNTRWSGPRFFGLKSKQKRTT